ncbi:hypothetical protein L484_012202 [Morus notabilis]|uniref:Uncharacterized protein n=1 Tax=Morus notabilis TaxID=981085 RepID=W9R9S7_9ROSA|nr:hypothetical protein L484_012202 [Morus notabilis]
MAVVPLGSPWIGNNCTKPPRNDDGVPLGFFQYLPRMFDTSTKPTNKLTALRSSARLGGQCCIML